MQTFRTSLLTLVFALVACVGIAQTAHAQTPTVTDGQRLLWDHPGIDTETWDYKLDAGAWIDVVPTKGAQVGTTTPALFTYSIPFPAATPGIHTVTIRACGAAGCTESEPFGFKLVALPAKPINLRIGAAAQ